MPVAVENAPQIILKAAREQLFIEGIHQLSIRKIAKRSGIAIGTFYNYYPTKKELIGSLMVDYWEEFFRTFPSQSADEQDLFQSLKIVFDKLNRFVEIFADAWLNLAENGGEVPQYNHSAQQQAYLQRLAAVIEDLLGKGPEIAAPSLETDELAHFIVLNFLTIIYTHQLSYETFEKILHILTGR